MRLNLGYKANKKNGGFRVLNFRQIVFFVFVGMNFFGTELKAETIAFGLNVGVDFPLAHRDRLNAGVMVEANYRLDPYEVRFHYAYVNSHYYSLGLGHKFFFSQAVMRPYLEPFLGLAIVNTKGEGLSYGVNPTLSLGVDLAVNTRISTQIAARYSGYVYFGETKGGSWQAHHMLSVLGGVSLWF